MSTISRFTPCLWFDGRGEEAARFYTSVFKNSRITSISRYGEEGRDIHGRTPGSVLTVEFEIDGAPFTALNGGPNLQFNEAVSFQVNCRNQEEIDYFWDKLGEGGDPNARQCGWLKDRFGVSWQIVPDDMAEVLKDAPNEKSERAMAAMFKMKKLDLTTIRKAYEG
jgi:predicted 3-demethylubiquinone-9 3-methyltransferase (glyoxalase superfamily)